MKRILCLIIFIIFFIPNTWAANWQYLGTTSHGIKYYADADRIYKDDIYCTFWLRSVDLNGIPTDALTYLYHYDKSFQHKYMIAYNAQNEIIDQWEINNSPYMKIPSGSILEAVYNSAWPK